MGQEPKSGDELRDFYATKAREAGVILEADDEMLVEQAAATLDLIGALQDDLVENGVMLVSATGASKVNPAAGEIRHQRGALTRLTVTISARIETASTGVRPVGVQPGSTRKPYAVGGGAAPRRGTPANRRRGA